MQKKMQMDTIKGAGKRRGKYSDENVGKNSGDNAVRRQVSK